MSTFSAGVVGNGERNTALGQTLPVVLDRTLSYPAAFDDSLDYAVNVWQRDATTCSLKRPSRCTASAPSITTSTDLLSWSGMSVLSDAEDRDALMAAVTALESWVKLGLDTDQWRARASLPVRVDPP